MKHRISRSGWVCVAAAWSLALTSTRLAASDDHPDIVVYGGTCGGVAAAVQAARMGHSVVLIEPGRRLGGLTSGGLGLTDVGSTNIVGGIAREFYHRIWQHYRKDEAWVSHPRELYEKVKGQGVKAMDDSAQLMWAFEPHVAEAVFRDLAVDAGVRVVQGRLYLSGGVLKHGSRIEAIRLDDGRVFAAKMFIDATYEGDLMAGAGVSYAVGREANTVYGETLNGIQVARSKGNQLPAGIDAYRIKGQPDSGLLPGVNRNPGGADGTGDRKLQAYCFRMCLTDVPGNRVAIVKPDGYDEAQYELLFRAIETGATRFFKLSMMPNRKTDSNNSGGISCDFIGMNHDYLEADYAKRERIAKAHEDWQRGLVWTLQHHPRVPEAIREFYAPWGLPKDEFGDTGHWAWPLYVREGRRLVGVTVETETSLLHDEGGKRSIGMGAYAMDSHNVQRYVDEKGHVRNEGDVQAWIRHPYRIDYGAIAPRAAECENLLVPVCVSASHIAYGSIRMEPVFMILGQAAGTAASLALAAGVPVQNVDYPVLRDRLLRDGQVLSLPPKESALRDVSGPDGTPGAAPLGNVFVGDGEVSIPVVAHGDGVTWTVTDYRGVTVAQGHTPVRNQWAVVRPGIKRNGYYLVHLIPMDGTKAADDFYTSFAIIPPVTVTDKANSPFGVMTHFAQKMDPDILPLLAKAGIVAIRDEHYWGQVEKKTNVFEFSSMSDTYMKAVKTNGLDPLIAMTFENKIYDKGLTPHTPAGCEAYGRYGQALLKHYGDQIKWLEIWNEYNGSWCKGPAVEDRPRYYVQMLRHAYQGIKEVRPDVKVLGCATVLVPMPYLEGIFKNGGLDYMDAVVLHPYRGQPEGVETEVAEAQAMIRKYNHGKDKPIWITETGRMDKSEYGWEEGKKMYEKGRAYTARYLIRQYTLLLSCRCEKIFWYLCRDFQNFVGMGLVRNVDDRMGRYAVAPAYVAYATLIRQLDGARYVGRAETSKFTYIQQFDRKGEEVRVCWATQPDTVTVRCEGPVKVVDMMGGEQSLQPVEGEITLTLNEDPVFLKGKVQRIDGKGRFSLAGEQNVDVLDSMGIEYALAGGSGVLEIDGKSYSISAPGGRVICDSEESRAPRTRKLPYRLFLGKKQAGMGEVTVNVVDPVVKAGAVQAVRRDTLTLSLANTATRQEYGVTGIRVNLDGAMKSNPVTASLAPGKLLEILIPVTPLDSYLANEIDLAVDLKNRAAFSCPDEVSYNPCQKHSPTVDGDLADWRGIEPMDFVRCARIWAATNKGVKGQIRMSWDDHALYLAASVDPKIAESGVRFAVAPAFEGFWRDRKDTREWTEWVARQVVGGRPELAMTLGPEGRSGGDIKAHQNSDTIDFEIALPWTVLSPAKPADGSFRLAVQATAMVVSKPVWVEWGTGILMGKSPDGFRNCKLVGAGHDASRPETKVTGFGRTVMTAGGPVVADSETDYGKEQGYRNWYYGYYDGSGKGEGDGVAPIGAYTDDDFMPMRQIETMWGYIWGGESKYLSLTGSGAHPGIVSGRPVWAVRRWKSDVGGCVRLTGFFQGNESKGDGIGGRILVDGVQMYECQAGGKNHPKRVDYDMAIPVRKGSRVDFAVTPGKGLSLDFDAATCGIKIRESGLENPR